MIGPRLHHLAPTGKVLGVTVHGPDLVLIDVAELTFDPLTLKSKLVEHRAADLPETVWHKLVAQYRVA